MVNKLVLSINKLYNTYDRLYEKYSKLIFTIMFCSLFMQVVGRVYSLFLDTNWIGIDSKPFTQILSCIIVSIIATTTLECILLFLLIIITSKYKLILNAFVLLKIIFLMSEYLVYAFRGRLWFFSDLYSFTTALKVLNRYTLTSKDILILFSMAIVGTSAILIYNKLTSLGSIPKLKKNKLIVTTVLGIYLGVALSINLVPVPYSAFNQVTNYFVQIYGIDLSFYNSIFNIYKQPPENYSKERVEKFIESYTIDSTSSEKHSDIEPDIIICIMNESLVDFSLFNDEFEKYSQDSVYHGYLLSSVMGGGTPVSEYEFLTNNCIFNVDEPMYMHLNYNINSIAHQLKQKSYNCTYIHPYLPSSWNRHNVYPYLGFDNAIFKEGQDTYEWLDDTVYNNLDLDTTKQFYFIVTMQNHGGYSSFTLNKNNEQLIPKSILNHLNQDETLELNEYLYRLRLSHTAFDNLIKRAEVSDKNIMIIMFGDHQPYISDNVVKQIGIVNYQQYLVPYYLYTNYHPLSLNYSSPASINTLNRYVLNETGIPVTGYQDYVYSSESLFKSMNFYGYLDFEDNFIEWENCKDKKILDWYDVYRSLSYYVEHEKNKDRKYLKFFYNFI